MISKHRYGHWSKLRLRQLEDRTAPASLNTLLTRAEPTLLGDTANGTSYLQYDPTTYAYGRNDSLSADGRFVAFTTDASNVVPGQVDTNGTYDVFLHDRVSNATVLVSGANGSANETANSRHVYVNSQGPFNGSSFPSISADGRYVTFTSTATNLVPGYTSSADAQNTYVYDRVTAQSKLVSHRFDSLTASASSYSDYACVSLNGDFITFRSNAVDLVAEFSNPGGGATTTYPHVYAYDIATEQVTLLDHKFGSVNVPANNRAAIFGAMPGGRYILFQSYATNVWEQATTGKQNLYMHDRQTGINLLITKGTSSVAPFGGDGPSGGNGISADGKWICVISQATNLIPGATSTGEQIMLYDVVAGTLRLVSHAAGNSLVGGNDKSSMTVMSSDGRYIGFTSKATDLIAGYVDGSFGYDIFLYDRDTDQTALVNHLPGAAITSSNGSLEYASWLSHISSDGRYVMFVDNSNNLVTGFVDQNGPNNYDTFRFDRLSGEVALVSGQDNSATVGSNGDSYYSAMSADGQYVAIVSEAADFSSSVVDTNGQRDVYLRNLTTGATTLASRRFGTPSLSAGGEGFWINQTPDGRFVVFCDTANNLVPGQVESTLGTSDVFLLDRVTNTTVLVSHAVGSPSKEAIYDSGLPVISADGRYVAYVSYATDLVPGFVDSNGLSSIGTDVFLYDRLTGVNELVSRQVGTTNVGGNNGSGNFFGGVGQLSISGDGRWICFQSQATDLMGGFANNNGTGANNIGVDVFLFDRMNGTSILPNHLPGQPTATANGFSGYGVVSFDGRYVAYDSASTNSIPGMTSGGGSQHLLLFDRLTDTNVLITHAAESLTTGGNKFTSSVPLMSRDGKFIAYSSFATNLVPGGIDTNGVRDMYVYDVQNGTNILLSHVAGSSTTAANHGNYPLVISNYNDGRFISADGRYIVYESESQDLIAGFVDGYTPSFSTDIYLFDRVTGVNMLVSRTAVSATKSGNYESWGPTISGDGRFVSFISGATDLVNGFIGTLPPVGYLAHLYVFDRLTGLTKLVSHDATNPMLSPLDDGPGSPSINADGSVIAYTNRSKTIVAGDLNGFADIFAYVTPPPRVSAVQINDGSAQRSTIRSLTITLDDYVFVDSGPLTLVNNQGSGISSQVSIQYQGNTTILSVTFSGTNTEFGSLADGNYELRVLGSQVSGVGFLDGNGDGVGGDDFTFTFHRLFGDSNGDRKVNTIDFTALRGAFGLGGITFDFNNDGIVNATDFAQFRARFGLSLN